MKTGGSLIAEIIETIGEDGLVRLAEAFGGTRLYVPVGVVASLLSDNLTEIIGAEAARALSERFAPDSIRVPLAREYRARHYLTMGKTYPQIARALGMTETSVEKMFKRIKRAGAVESAR